MTRAFQEKSHFNQYRLLKNNDVINSHILPNKFNINEKNKNFAEYISDNEKHKIKLHYFSKEISDFLISKYEAMEKIELDDECLTEGKDETKKINIDKDVFPKFKHTKNKKNAISQKKINKKNNLKKKIKE